MRRELTRRSLRLLVNAGDEGEAAARIVEHVAAVGIEAAFTVLETLNPIEARRLRDVLTRTTAGRRETVH